MMLGNSPAVGATPRRTGALLTAAMPGGGEQWRHGTVVWPESAPGWEIAQECTDVVVDYGLGVGSAPVGARPFMVRTRTDCPRTSDLDVLRERALRHIDAVTGQAVARELWTGAASIADPWTAPTTTPFLLANPRADAGTGVDGPWLNPYLVAADMLDPADDPATAIGRIEAAAADRMAGGPVYLHVPVDIVLALGQFLSLEGDLLRTPLGSIVVADAGYPGTAVDGGPLVVYGTGPVQVWLDDPHVFGEPEEIVSFHHNRVGVWAERPAMALFDPQTLVGCTVTP